MVRFLQAFFRWFALILPALFQLLPHSTLDRFLWVRARLFVQATYPTKGFYATKFFSKLRHLFHACQVPFDTPGSGTYRNQSCMPGPLISAFVQLPNCMWDQLDKQYTAEN